MGNTEFNFDEFEKQIEDAASAMEAELNKPYLEQLERAYRKNAEMADDILHKQTSWLRYLVTTISVLFGILVALGGSSSSPRQIRFVFAIAAVLLSLSILALSVSLYAELYYLRRKKRLHHEAAKRAFQEKHQMQSVAVPTKRIFSTCETIGYICFVLALLALAVYTLLQALF